MIQQRNKIIILVALICFFAFTVDAKKLRSQTAQEVIVSEATAEEQPVMISSDSTETPGVDEDCFGVMFDAGSSGTRYVVYRWQCRAFVSLPEIEIEPIASNKNNNPLAEYFSKPGDIKPAFEIFFEEIKKVVPADKHANTLLYLGATAGMRRLTKMQQFTVIDRVRATFRESGFRFIDDSKALVTTGEQEATFLWVAVNYVLKNVRKSLDIPNPNTVTTIDIGGASTQIAYVDKQDDDSESFFNLALPENNTYLLKAYSDLLGQDVSRYEVLQQEVALQNLKENDTVVASCFNKGYENKDKKLNGRKIQGKSDPVACVNLIRNLFQISECPYPENEICAEKTPQIPKAPEGKEVYAVSAAVYAKEAYKFPDVFDPVDLRNAAVEFCSKDWSEVQDPNNKYGYLKCFQGLYVSTLLIDGYGVGGRKINVPSIVNNWEPSWTLGQLLYEVSQLECDPTVQDSACNHIQDIYKTF